MLCHSGGAAPLALAVDTTGECGSLALVEGERTIEEAPLHSPDGFGHILFDEIEKLLARHDISVEQIDVFAAASGPGSFTGVRIGLVAVKGLAEAAGRRVAAISNLQALAWFGTRALRAAVIDARRDQVYGAVYDSALRLVGEETVMKFPAWMAALPAGDLEIITCGYSIPPGDIPVIKAPISIAGAIGRIAIQRLNAGLAQDPAAIDANYVRRADAELMWKEQ